MEEIFLELQQRLITTQCSELTTTWANAAGASGALTGDGLTEKECQLELQELSQKILLKAGLKKMF